MQVFSPLSYPSLNSLTGHALPKDGEFDKNASLSACLQIKLDHRVLNI